MPSDVDKHTKKAEGCDYLSTIEGAVCPEQPESIGLAAETEKENKRFKQLNIYHDVVYDYLMKEIHQAEIIRKLREQGYHGSKSNAEYYVKSIREKYGIVASKRKRKRNSSASEVKVGSKSMDKKELMKRIWEGKGFSAEERDILNQTHPALLEMESCVKKFQKIYEQKSLPLLYLFIEEYISCPYKKLSDFAKSLLKDIDAVENSVVSEKSNGFVEGTNSQIKMIKRTMYGRSGLLLLSAKLMFRKWENT